MYFFFPSVFEQVEFIDSGTPISHRYYIDSPRGEIYGLDHATERFQHDIAMDLRPKTDVEGLYLTGKSEGFRQYPSRLIQV